MALISFDLDGVLQRSPWRSGRPDGVFAHIQRELAALHDPANPEAAVDRILDLILEEHQARLHSGRLVEAHDWDDIAGFVAAQLNVPYSLKCADLVTQYCEVPGLSYLYDGAPECLQTLKEQGHTLVTITNGFRDYQAPVLRKHGVLHLFDDMITPEAVGAAKPETPIFRAAERFGGPVRIHVGDVLPHDIAGAKRAGWLAIYVCQPGAPGYTELTPELAALPPHRRPAAGPDWLTMRLERDRRHHGHPPAELPECTPDAIVHRLDEIPAAVAALTQA